MTKEQMIGQMLLGVTADPSTAAADVNRYSLAGVLFDSECFDYKTEEEVRTAVAQVASAAKIAPILAAQEEGGRVTTVTGHADTEKTFASPRNIFEEGGIAAVEKAEDEKAEYLKSLGFNLNLAPVIDLPNSLDQIMYSRSLSGDAQLTATYAEYVAKFNQAKGVSVALKHFPGYGTINDTVESIVVDTRDASTIRTTDYIPFKAGVAAGAHFVMVSNVVVESIDPSHIASTSSLLHQELRGAVGFTGIIMTDVIDRTDYSYYADGRSVPVAAVLAGNDLILVRDYAAAYTSILSAVNDNTIPIDTIQKACTRVIAYKYATGLLA
jgi:beta-N-acetylhexosaminidase